jgi:hypothetical protein
MTRANLNSRHLMDAVPVTLTELFRVSFSAEGTEAKELGCSNAPQHAAHVSASRSPIVPMHIGTKQGKA